MYHFMDTHFSFSARNAIIKIFINVILYYILMTYIDGKISVIKHFTGLIKYSLILLKYPLFF